MKEFKGTKGLSFSASKQTGKHRHAILAQVFNEDTGKSVCDFDTTDTEEEATENAVMVADAFETVNKCNLFPSEILEQRDGLLEALQRWVEFADSQKLDYESSMIRDSKKAIEKALNK